MIQKCVQENATAAQDQDEYLKRYNGLVAKYEAILQKEKELETKVELRIGRAESFDRFIRMFKKLQGNLISFDEDVWIQAIDIVKAKDDGTLVFVFQGGTEIEV